MLRMGSLMILARLLDPKDFGLVGMVTAVIGVFNIFRDFGLSAAAVQRATVSKEQSSTLFWVNLLVGAILGLSVLALAPFLAAFYHERRLIGVTAVLATGFLFNAAGIQHSTLLERQMRFTVLSVIDISSLVVSTAVGIGMAVLGFGYWALVATTAITPLVYSIGVWLTTRWIPGRPRKRMGVRSMMRFGATLTLNGLILYIADNLDKVLLGRYWGVEVLGIYGRAYQLINIPTNNLNYAAGGVAFAALSRVKDEPSRLKNYFLAGYSLVMSLTVPITLTCGLFAEDMIQVFLGPKWQGAVVIFRFLAPTALAFAILSPLAWLITALGMVNRGLKMALVFAPLLIVSYAIGLPYGPKGVAFAFSAMKLLTVIPMAAWATYGTIISLRDVLLTVGRPLISGIVAAAVAFGLQLLYGPLLHPLPRLALGTTIFSFAYLFMLLCVMRQKRFYLNVMRGFMTSSSGEEPLEALI
jgi:O-antigen/teichoic acid export membrane protein